MLVSIALGAFEPGLGAGFFCFWCVGCGDLGVLHHPWDGSCIVGVLLGLEPGLCAGFFCFWWVSCGDLGSGQSYAS